MIQIGTGANDKTDAFGGSSWLDAFSDQNHTIPQFVGGSLWDLNMDFTAAPEPSLIALLSVGLMVIGLQSVRKQNC